MTQTSGPPAKAHSYESTSQRVNDWSEDDEIAWQEHIELVDTPRFKLEYPGQVIISAPGPRHGY